MLSRIRVWNVPDGSLIRPPHTCGICVNWTCAVSSPDRATCVPPFMALNAAGSTSSIMGWNGSTIVISSLRILLSSVRFT